MKRIGWKFILLLTITLSLSLFSIFHFVIKEGKGLILLSDPEYHNGISFEESLVKSAIATRVSSQPVDLAELAEILWAAQGVTDPVLKFRAAPSPGATYPLEIIVIVGDDAVEGLDYGVYRYLPDEHGLELIISQDLRSEIASSITDFEESSMVKKSPITLVVTAVYERTAKKYGDRAIRYVELEVGCVTQNVLLMASNHGLCMGCVFDFDSSYVKNRLNSPEPILILPIGNPIKETVGNNPLSFDDSGLPSPRTVGNISLTKSIAMRRTTRDFGDGSMELNHVSQILWAANGRISDTSQSLTVPSINDVQLVDVYLVTDNIPPLNEGVHYYIPEKHGLLHMKEGDIKHELYESAYEDQYWVLEADFWVVIVVDDMAANEYFGEYADRIEFLQAGMSAMNLNLQATSLSLASGVVGAIGDEAVINALDLPKGQTPLFIVNVGHYDNG